MHATSLASLRGTFAVPQRTVGLSLLRLALGAITLINYLTHLYERPFIWGNDGQIPFAAFVAAMHRSGSFSLYQLSSSPLYSVGLFYLGLVVSFLFMVGYRTRLTSVSFFLLTWSLQQRNTIILNGGDNLLILLAFYLMFTDCGAYCSLDARRRCRKAARPFVALVHNYGLSAILIQIAILYATSTFQKITGHAWQDGTAIYYVLRTSEFNLTRFTPLIYSNALFVTALTYGTLLLQGSVPYLMWVRKAKPFLVLALLCFHLGIAYFMGLVWFSAVMMAAELSLFGNRDYADLVRRWHSALGLLRRLGTAQALAPARLNVYYDGWCPRCCDLMGKMTRRFDLFGLVAPQSFRRSDFTPPPGLTTADLERRMYVRRYDGRIFGGVHAVAAVLVRSPLLWPAVPFTWLAVHLGWGERLYDFIASHRTVVPTALCDGTCALQDEPQVLA